MAKSRKSTIGGRKSTPLPKEYLWDERLLAIGDPLAREAFFRAKLMADNLGRLPGNPLMLAGILFPANPPTLPKMRRIISDWVSAGLVFSYTVGARQAIEICDTGKYQTLIGNMSNESEFPPPPKELIEQWEAKHGTWEPLQRRGKESQTGTNEDEPVDTSSNANELVPGGLGRVGQGQGWVGLEGGRVGSNSGAKEKSAPPPVPPAISSGTADHDTDQGQPKTFREFLGDWPNDWVEQLEIVTNRVTRGAFDRELAFRNYQDETQFIGIVLDCAREWMNSPYKGRQSEIAFMDEVVDTCKENRFKAPEGWFKVMKDGKRELTAAHA